MKKITDVKNLPDNLGDIEFLRGHPAILKVLIERSSQNCLNGFIKDKLHNSCAGGLTWRDSIEGYAFWESVLQHEDIDVFYEKYPESAHDNHDGDGGIAGSPESMSTETKSFKNFLKK